MSSNDLEFIRGSRNEFRDLGMLDAREAES
jgi:hypothetical protein